MKNKATVTMLGVATLLAFGSVNSVFANDCNPCVAPPPPKPVAPTCNPCVVPPPPPKPVVATCNPCVVTPPLPPKPVVNTCTNCATTSVSYHPVKTGQFHEQLVPKDANGKPLACLDISGTSAKVGVDWTTSSGAAFTWGTHTTKYNSATVVEERYQ